jgi:hypothetical protein
VPFPHVAGQEARGGGRGGAGDEPKVNGSISKPMPVSDALRRFAGADEVSRSGAVKLIWAHIKAKGLQVLRLCHNHSSRQSLVLPRQISRAIYFICLLTFVISPCNCCRLVDGLGGGGETHFMHLLLALRAL